MPGPPKTPTQTLRLRGSWRADTRDGEPEVEPSLPDCPAWADEKAREYWDQISVHLYNLGVMSDVHSTALVMLVDSIALYVEAKQAMHGAGLTIETDKGNVIQHPLVGVRNKAWEQVMKALREFGMTPSAISNVRAPDKPQAKGLDRFKMSK